MIIMKSLKKILTNEFRKDKIKIELKDKNIKKKNKME